MKDPFFAILLTVDQIVEKQQEEMLKCARKITPHLTEDDVLQPNDFLELENNPHFRFEEGVLMGAKTVQMAISALQREFSKPIDDHV